MSTNTLISFASAPATRSTSYLLVPLEQTRTAFMSLLTSLDAVSARRKSTSSKRSLMAVAAHIVMSMEMTYPMFITRAQAGEALAMPAYFATPFGHWLSYVLSERRAKQESLSSLGRAYDAAHNKLTAQINSLADKDLGLVVTLPKPRNQPMSVETFLSVEIPAHFKLHEQEIRDSLG